MLLASSNLDGYVQLFTVLLIFIAVLVLTAFTTKYIANIQKQNCKGGNLEVIETIRISNTKYMQLVRVGDTYVAMAVCKDTVTKLCEIPKEQLREMSDMNNTGLSFKEILDSVKHKETKE